MLEPDVATLRALITKALRSPAAIIGMAQRAQALVDGHGARRVAGAMLPGELTFRRATRTDGDAILRWRNHPSIRAVSFDEAEIAPQAHREWLEATLRNPSRALLIAEKAGDPVGVVRFDLGGDVATISVYRVPGSDGGRGLIRSAVEWLSSSHPEISRIIAQVRAENATSRAAFGAAGFRETGSELVKELRR
jgi:RimJ/RimL family protein N-acetyltransferase